MLHSPALLHHDSVEAWRADLGMPAFLSNSVRVRGHQPSLSSWLPSFSSNCSARVQISAGEFMDWDDILSSWLRLLQSIDCLAIVFTTEGLDHLVVVRNFPEMLRELGQCMVLGDGLGG